MLEKFKFFIVPYLLKGFTLAVTMTCRVRWHNREAFDTLLAEQKPFVLGMWHNCSTICGWVMRNKGMAVMVSDSRDGEYVARLCKLFGNKTIRGSSSKGSLKAMYVAFKRLKEGEPIAITPDGPRGPRHKLQGGILWLAAATNSPILPLHIESSRRWVLNSWDKHSFPKPFSTIHVGFGQPLQVDQAAFNNDLENLTQHVETAMMENTDSVVAAANAS